LSVAAVSTTSAGKTSPGHSGRAPRLSLGGPSAVFDRLVGSDPGLNRLRNALMTVLTIGAIIEAEWLFVHFTHALQIPVLGAKASAAAATQVATANHEFLVIGIVVGAIVGMISAFGVFDATAEGQLKTILFLPIPMIAAMALGLELGEYRVVSLVDIAILLSIGTYLRRFGPRGMVGGLLLFLGDFLGFFLHAAVTLSDLGWLSAEIGVGLLVAIIVRFALFYPRPAKALERMERSYAARARRVTATALDLFDDPVHDERQIRRLNRHLVRLNEAALMIDAQFGDSAAVGEGSSGQRLHQRLFDVELALTNMARFAEALRRVELPTRQREHVRGALVALIAREAPAARAQATALMADLAESASALDHAEKTSAVIMHRFAESVIDLAEAATDWETLGMSGDHEEATFVSSVALFGGFLPGSAQVSRTASQEAGHHPFDRTTLAPYTRAAIQMGIAVGVAIAFGVMISSYRFYWAVIAVFVTFMGTNNAGEQVRKAVFRVLGTVVGIGVGSLLVTLIGHRTYWSIAAILVSLFFGLYFMRTSYAFMVIGVTVMVSQLYVEFGEYSNSLLFLRLEETAMGAAVAVAVVMLVLPLRTKKVVRVAMRNHVEALATLVDHATSRLIGEGRCDEASLRADARDLDTSYQALESAALPRRRNLAGSMDQALGTSMRLASASRHYGRNLVGDVDDAHLIDTPTRSEVEVATKTLLSSLAVVADALNGPRDGTYTRSASLFDRAERRLENSSGTPYGSGLAVRDLMLIDQTMASLAAAIGLHVTDLDTAMLGARPPADLQP
jgi:uncharacterized membrane protein YccC